MKKCHHCDAELDAAAAVCPQCGTEYTEIKLPDAVVVKSMFRAGIAISSFALLLLIGLGIVVVSEATRNTTALEIILYYSIAVLLLGLGILAKNRVAKWTFLILFPLEILFWVYALIETDKSEIVPVIFVKIALYAFVLYSFRSQKDSQPEDELAEEETE
ncbi:MAG: zinc ribbon domain-containing protein [Bacteroidota bacterium]